MPPGTAGQAKLRWLPGCRDAVPGAGRSLSGMGSRSVCPVPGCEHLIAPRRRLAEARGMPLSAGTEWSASALICGDHQRPSEALQQTATAISCRRGAASFRRRKSSKDGDWRDSAGDRQFAHRPPARDGRRGRSAARFCGVKRCGDPSPGRRVPAARRGTRPTCESLPIGATIAASPGSVMGARSSDRRSIHVADYLVALPEMEFPETLARAQRATAPIRTRLATPRCSCAKACPSGAIWIAAVRGSAVHRPANRAPGDLCRPGGHRDRDLRLFKRDQGRTDWSSRRRRPRSCG